MARNPNIEPGSKNDRMTGNGPGATPGANFAGAASMLALAGAMGWMFLGQPGRDGQPIDSFLTIVGLVVVLPCLGMAAYLTWYGARRLRWRRRNIDRTGGQYLGMWKRTPSSPITQRESDRAEQVSRWSWLVDLQRLLGP